MYFFFIFKIVQSVSIDFYNKHNKMYFNQFFTFSDQLR